MLCKWGCFYKGRNHYNLYNQGLNHFEFIARQKFFFIHHCFYDTSFSVIFFFLLKLKQSPPPPQKKKKLKIFVQDLWVV